MSYADGLLTTGERVLHRSRQHPIVIIWRARWVALAGIAAGMVWLAGSLEPDGLSGSLRGVLGWLTALLVFGSLASVAWGALHWASAEYVLTNRRVIGVEGVLSRMATDSSLEKIDDAVLSQSLLGRSLDFGDLTVRMTSEVGIGRMSMVRDPLDFKRILLDAKDDREAEIQRSGWMPGPPIRAVGSDQPAVADARGLEPAAGALGSSSPPKAHPGEVAQTMATLADLRDRGVISAADYDAKKRDLLTRL